MITLEEFNHIQAVKKGLSNMATAPRTLIHPDFPLRRFVRCECGKGYTGSWRQGRSEKYPRYHCNNRVCNHYSHVVAKNELEDKFIQLLEDITPSKKFLKIFERAILDQWRNKYAIVKAEATHYNQTLKNLEARRERVVEMRLNGEFSPLEFKKHKDQIDNEIAGIQISNNEAKIDELDMEACITRATQVIRSITQQWQHMCDPQQRQRLQKMVFPEGLTYNKTAGVFGTAILSPVFTLFQESTGKDSDFVAGAGIAPAPSGYEPDEVLLLHPAMYYLLFNFIYPMIYDMQIIQDLEIITTF